MNTLAIQPQNRALGEVDRCAFEPQNWTDAARMAEALHKSGLLPDSVRTPQAALAIIIQGRELGLTVMQSLRGISVINGKPSPSAQLMVALVKRSHVCEYLECISSDAESSTWRTRRRGEQEVRITWTIEDAKRAGLLRSGKDGGPGMWARFPRNMLKWRAATDLCREVYPDVVGGLYTPEELTESAPPAERSPEIVSTVESPSARERLLASLRQKISVIGQARARELLGVEDLAEVKTFDDESLARADEAVTIEPIVAEALVADGSEAQEVFNGKAE